MIYKKITFADTDVISDYDDIARIFFRDMFGLNYDECFVSDESILGDFMPELDDFDESLTLAEYHTLGNQRNIENVLKLYGLDVGKFDYLHNIFEQIRQQNIKVKQ